MARMFRGCSQLRKLDVSSFDTGRAGHMENMFYGCENLEKLDVSHFDISNAADLSFLFYGCRNLENLKINARDLHRRKNVLTDEMFTGCEKLHTGGSYC